MSWDVDLLLVPLAYLLGSISSAILVCRLLGLPDPRTEGSQNPGATNVLRIGGRLPAAITLAGDFLKGYLPVAAAVLLQAGPVLLGATMLAAFFGHLYPLFFRFRGGKGVATGLGVLCGLSLMAGGSVILVWLLVAALFRYSSLAALISSLAAPPIVQAVTGQWALAVASVIMAMFQFWKHRSNIEKLLAGTESRIGARRDPPVQTTQEDR